jgi:23S rRNA (pseudouridine1915-N3)-methyltransferase
VRVRVVAVGKLKDKGLRAAVEDYWTRIRRYARPEETELKDADPGTVAARMRRAIPERSRVIALEVDGRAWSSERLADFVGQCEIDGVQSLVFLIGGSHGMPPEVSREADVRLSLSAMTLPHRLVRVVLAEQIYRAFTILRNEPYSH